ncbi:unnamed protein product [Rotaria socialis]
MMSSQLPNNIKLTLGKMKGTCNKYTTIDVTNLFAVLPNLLIVVWEKTFTGSTESDGGKKKRKKEACLMGKYKL